MLSPPVSAPISGSVCAVVVTYNRQELLTRCLRALQEQTRTPDAILVVDNASTDGTRAVIEAHFPEVETLFLSQNGGGAGGFHAGLRHAFERGFDWFWIMDDDGTPQSDCLQLLLQQTQSGDASFPTVVAPIQQDSGGRRYGIGVWNRFYLDVTSEVVAGTRAACGPYLFAFVGPLISRGVIEKIGLPRREFFIWFDDYEFGLRLHNFPDSRVIAVPEAVFFHDIGGKTRAVRFLGRQALRNESPAWKTYYGTRNHLFTVTRTRRSAREFFWFLVRETWLLAGDFLFEPDRWRRTTLRLRGLCDGMLGRMEKRVKPKA